ncbi:MAG TPA: hypothetical protein VD968_02025 [Pyrinomonadaceae bacterium]|nr:hypothetical protein [Pyrinomonadaceae bacterium]
MSPGQAAVGAAGEARQACEGAAVAAFKWLLDIVYIFFAVSMPARS